MQGAVAAGRAYVRIEPRVPDDQKQWRQPSSDKVPVTMSETCFERKY